MTKKLPDLHGIITVLNTPFHNDDTIDLSAVARNTERAIRAGVAGFLVPAMASEVSTLSEYERREVVRTVVQTSAGRVPVIGGCSAPTHAERLSNLHLMGTLGCAAGLVALPYEDDQHYAAQAAELAEAAPGFLMIQDWDATGYGVPVSLIARLFKKIPKLRAIKVEVVPAGRKYSEILEATDGKLHVSGGWAVSQMIEGLDRGVHAFMPTGMHEIYTQIYTLYRNGHRDDAQELFYDLLPVLAFANQHLDISIHFFKRLLHREGVFPTTRVRAPVLPFDAIHEQTADALIERVFRITAGLQRQ